MGDISDGSSLNRYAYAGGNPVTMVDSFGLSPESSSASIYGNLLARLDSLFSGGRGTGTQSSGDGWEGAKQGALQGAIEGGATGYMFGAVGGAVKQTIQAV